MDRASSYRLALAMAERTLQIGTGGFSNRHSGGGLGAFVEPLEVIQGRFFVLIDPFEHAWVVEVLVNPLNEADEIASYEDTVDHRVPDLASLVIAVIPWRQPLTSKPGGEVAFRLLANWLLLSSHVMG